MQQQKSKGMRMKVQQFSGSTSRQNFKFFRSQQCLNIYIHMKYLLITQTNTKQVLSLGARYA